MQQMQAMPVAIVSTQISTNLTQVNISLLAKPAAKAIYLYENNLYDKKKNMAWFDASIHNLKINRYGNF